MARLIKGLLVAGLLVGTASTPALAQRHDSHHQQPSRSTHKVMKYREVTVSHGHKWRKGQRLAANQRRYVVSDWNQRGLRAPPRGYQWVRENNNNTGDFILVAAATGIIASILSQ